MSSSRPEPEAVTRVTRIDPQLKRAGWTVAAFVEGHPIPVGTVALTEYPTANGPADYLLAIDGNPVGVIEAKKLTIGPAGVLTQAERYARGLGDTSHDYRGLRVPFLYSTNGESIHFHDVRHALSTSRRVTEFHSPSAFRELLARNLPAACDWFAANPNRHHRLRPYQVQANAAVEKAIAERKRRMMVAMATGTGKTFTLVNQVYRLLRSGAARRILFLVDRRALAAQAAKAFATFEPEPNQRFTDVYKVYSQRFRKEDFGEDEKFDPALFPEKYLSEPPDADTFVCVCTIQRLAIQLLGRAAVWSGEGDDIDPDADKIDNIAIHAFDVVVADECHRGYTAAEESVWRQVLDHFDAIKIGLTATPAPHTKAYFVDKVFEYSYTTAVREGHLVDYDVVKLKSDVRLEGVILAEGEKVQYIDPESGNDELFDQVEEQREFAPADLEKLVTSPDSNRKILLEIKNYADAHEAKYGRFPKTLIFAANDVPHFSHADRLVEQATSIFGRGEGFVRKITGRSDRPLQLIREFRNRPAPGIVVTVDLLSTGVDIPDLEYIVFLRPVRSHILFEQMLGRGTRKGEHHPGKSHFVVFDCFDGQLLAYFRDKSKMAADPPDKPTRAFKDIVEDIWANQDRDYNVRSLVKRLQRVAKEMPGDAREKFAAFGIPDGDLGKFASELTASLRQQFTERMKLLRNPEFQNLVISTKRPKPRGIIAVENEDTVSSEYLVRDGAGREYKPADYLELFSRFVKENAEQVDALGILLSKPRGWNTAALTKLKQTLTTAPGAFTVEKLRIVHRAHYKKDLVDIISMVKHAAKEGEPLLTAAERVERAFERLSKGKTFTPEQTAWWERIRQHLVENLTIERVDFDDLPILADPGGWGNANKAFEGNLNELLIAINEAVAA